MKGQRDAQAEGDPQPPPVTGAGDHVENEQGADDHGVPGDVAVESLEAGDFLARPLLVRQGGGLVFLAAIRSEVGVAAPVGVRSTPVSRR